MGYQTRHPASDTHLKPTVTTVEPLTEQLELELDI